MREEGTVYFYLNSLLVYNFLSVVENSPQDDDATYLNDLHLQYEHMDSNVNETLRDINSWRLIIVLMVYCGEF